MFFVLRVSSQDGLFNFRQAPNSARSQVCIVTLQIRLHYPSQPLPVRLLFRTEQASYGSAYTSGIGEDVDFVGKDYIYMNTAYQFIYLVYQMLRTP
jgi:hypothetical protein